MVKLSVIIPAYNSESYLPDTLESLLSQTFKDFEVIIVNDGSTDATQSIIDRYCENFSFIKSIVQKNGGVSSARNNGLSKATGDYVVFLDADDWYTPSSLEAFYDTAQKTGADIVMGRLRNYTDKKPGPFHAFADELAKETEIETFDKRLLWSVLVSNKCYRREFLIENAISFPPYTFSEEAVFFLKAVYCRAKITGTTASCLCYRRHTPAEGESVSQRACKESLRSLSGCMSEVYSLAKDALKSADESFKTAYLEEIVFKQLHVLVSQFYRKLWTLDEDSMAELSFQFESLRKKLTEKRFFELCDSNRDLDLEHFRGSHTKVCKEPLFSFYAGKSAEDSPLIFSLYAQSCPLFEVFAEGSYEITHKPMNLCIVKNKAEARQKARNTLISLSPKTVFDENALKTLIRLSLPISGLTLKALNTLLLKRRGSK